MARRTPTTIGFCLIAALFTLSACQQTSAPAGTTSSQEQQRSQSQAFDPSRYKADLPLDEKVKLSQQLAAEKRDNSMQFVSIMFPGLEKTKVVVASDPENLARKGDEVWYYSKDLDKTFVATVTNYSLILIFNGKDMTKDEFVAARSMLNPSNAPQQAQNTPSLSVAEQKAAMDNTAKNILAEDKPVYTPYTDELYNGIKGKKSFALFFYASWDPISGEMDKNIGTAIASFPKGTVIIKTDYDAATELKKTYDVKSQATVVVINAKGEAVAQLLAPANDAIKAGITKSLVQ